MDTDWQLSPRVVEMLEAKGYSVGEGVTVNKLSVYRVSNELENNRLWAAGTGLFGGAVLLAVVVEKAPSDLLSGAIVSACLMVAGGRYLIRNKITQIKLWQAESEETLDDACLAERVIQRYGTMPASFAL